MKTAGIRKCRCDDIEALRLRRRNYILVCWRQKNRTNTGPHIPAGQSSESRSRERFYPDALEIDYDKDRFTIQYDGHVHDLRGRSDKTFEWEFVPLKQPIERGVELFNANNKLLVFEWPEEGYDYGTRHWTTPAAPNRTTP